MSTKTPDQDVIAGHEMAVLRALRDRGFCVVVWNPTEVGEADVGTLEDIVIERASNYLGSPFEEPQ
jgi:hypothetical protein